MEMLLNLVIQTHARGRVPVTQHAFSLPHAQLQPDCSPHLL